MAARFRHIANARMMEAGWLTAALVVPLALNPWGLDAFGVPKAALLRALVLLMLPLALVRAGDLTRTSLRRLPPLFFVSLALLLVLLISTALSRNPLTSIFGRYERQQGLLTLGALLLLLLMTTATLETREQRDRLWRVLIWGSVGVVGYGLLQALQMDPFHWRTDSASPIQSTLGRSNFLGSYLVLIIPLTAARMALTRRRGWYLLLLGAQLVCLWLTEARAAWVGLFAAGIAVALIAGLRGRNQSLLRATLGAMLAAAALLALVSSASAFAPLQNMPGGARLADALRTDRGATAARLTIWQTTLELAAERPLFGYGPEMLASVFLAQFPPQLVYYEGREAVVDRAHNVWLDWLMIGGIAGFAAIAGFWLRAGQWVWGRLRCAQDVWERALQFGVAGGLMAHLVDLQFSFDTIATSTVLVLVVALGVARESAEPVGNRSGSPLYLLPPAIAAIGLVWLISIRPLIADSVFWQATREANTADVRLSAARSAVDWWPVEPAYRLGLAQALAASGNFAAGAEQVRAFQRMRGDDAEAWMASGRFYAERGERDETRYAEAEEAYRHAIALAPNVARYHSELGSLCARQGRWEASARELERAVDLDATDVAAYKVLAEVYAAQGLDASSGWAQKQAVYWEERLQTPGRD